MSPQKPQANDGPADLAQLQATDALLDRLAAGTPSAEDRHDPLIEAFAVLRAELDGPRDAPGVDMARLLDVLGERPLFLVEDGEAEPIDETGPIALPRVEQPEVDRIEVVVQPADPATSAPQGAPAKPGLAAAYGVAARSVSATVHALGAGRRAGHGNQAPESELTGWYGVLQHAALPAAAAVVGVLALGSGLSVAVTGDPMAPVSGVSRVVSQLPGIAGPKPSVDQVSRDIDQAGRLADQDPERARELLAQAERKVGDLPDGTEDALRRRIANIRTDLGAPATPTPSSAVSASPAPSSTPVPTTTPPSSEQPSATVAPSSAPPTEPEPSVGGETTTTSSSSASSTSVSTSPVAPDTLAP